MNIIRKEKRVLRLTYLLVMALFFNVAIITPTINNSAVIIGAIICVLMAYAHFVIRRFYPDGDKFLLLFANILAVIGIAMIYRLDLPLQGGTFLAEGVTTNLAVKQVLFFALGMIGFILIVVIVPDLKRFSKYKYFYMIVTLAFMAMGTFLGKETNGAKNWVSIAGFGFQPSEFGKIALVAYLASALKDYEKPAKFWIKAASKVGIKDEKYYSLLSLVEPALVMGVSLLFMLAQTDLGSALIFFAIALTMLYIATSKKKYVIIALLLFAVGGFIGYKLFYHVRVRVAIWRNPWEDGFGQGHQLVQSLIAISSGGLFGAGLGRGFPNYIPVVESDFIFAAICEELGILTGFAIIIFNFLLFYRCIRAALYTKDKFSRLLVVGYSTMLVAQTLVIIGGVTGAIPLTGITLPFVSYGGSSMLISYFALGIIQKISEESNSYE